MDRLKTNNAYESRSNNAVKLSNNAVTKSSHDFLGKILLATDNAELKMSAMKTMNNGDMREFMSQDDEEHLKKKALETIQLSNSTDRLISRDNEITPNKLLFDNSSLLGAGTGSSRFLQNILDKIPNGSQNREYHNEEEDYCRDDTASPIHEHPDLSNNKAITRTRLFVIFLKDGKK
mmetsp:Transcript_33760/g.34247  ORF Transcript_33760/g.34247 Transcript_33760/m.34247 type:complete len:177 (-) Transcript_33760:42-572(-)